MNISDFRDYCLAKKGSTESFPFDDKVLVFKAVKMFALARVDCFESINLKCDPARAIELREKYQGISPGYHMNKKHWNTILVNSDAPESLILELIDHSYELICLSLTKKQRDELQAR